MYVIFAYTSNKLEITILYIVSLATFATDIYIILCFSIFSLHYHMSTASIACKH